MNITKKLLVNNLTAFFWIKSTLLSSREMRNFEINERFKYIIVIRDVLRAKMYLFTHQQRRYTIDN